ncbi:class I SAM-dependent methyltransferase [Pseudogracilibacillus sp. SO10305]|uniref:class I SAM-dependent methyltransferase n=1 Tax=Pseudogracilibacillus sp. SO10305 TaxID=3098292 RepID=UPI00300DE859
MEFNELKETFVQKVMNELFIHGTISQPRQKSNDLKRVRLKKIALQNELYIQFEYQYERIMKHENILLKDIGHVLDPLLEEFRQVHAQFETEQIHIQISKKFKVMWKTTKEVVKKAATLEHNRKKNYLLDENTVHPFLVRLGVQTETGQIKKAHYDKFRQINRFIEYIDDAIEYLPKNRTVRILDFGSGKSYLTFALYHYLHVVKGYDIQVTGLDLKKEVIEHCQQIANDLQYEHLQFLVGDINDFNEETSVDMVVTLHACDVATDMALARAVRWGANVILSVPFCQHELFSQMDAPALDVLLQHGLMKERFAALATDAIRAEILSLVGYETQLLEFIDMEHTPKNILIRAYYTGKESTKAAMKKYESFRDLLTAKPFLEKELHEHLYVKK